MPHRKPIPLKGRRLKPGKRPSRGIVIIQKRTGGQGTAGDIHAPILTYDAATNTPDLDVAPGAGVVLQGARYRVTVAGSFFTELVEPGDWLEALIDDPAALSDWLITQGNVLDATESVAGIVERATQAEVDTGTDTVRYVSPATLAGTPVTPAGHGTSHTDGSDDIQNATAAQKGLATAAQITKLDGIETGATADQTGAEIKAAYEAEANAYTDTKNTKLGGVETGATADQTDVEIEAAYQNEVPLVSQGDAEAGTAVIIESWSAERVAQAIAALAGGGGGPEFSRSFNQITHGLAVRDRVRSSGVNSEFAQAQGDTGANALAIGTVTAVADVDNITILFDGPIVGGYTGLTAGKEQYLDSTTPGPLTETVPSVQGTVDRTMAVAINDTEMVQLSFVGSLIGAAPMTVGRLDGLQMVFSSVSVVDVAAGSCRNSDDTFNIVLSALQQADITVSGVGGLDTGSEASATWYAVLVIADSTGVNATDVLLSLSDTAPTLPSGYDKFRRVGWVRNDGSSDILEFRQRSNGRTRKIHYDERQAALNNGSATSYTDVDLSAFLPPTSDFAFLLLEYSPEGSGNVLRLRPNGSTQTNWQRFRATGSEETTCYTEIPTDGSQLIEYDWDAADSAVDIQVMGYEDEL